MLSAVLLLRRAARGYSTAMLNSDWNPNSFGWDTQDLHREDRMALYANMYEVTYQPRETIIRAGEPGRNFYFILSVRGPHLPPSPCSLPLPCRPPVVFAKHRFLQGIFAPPFPCWPNCRTWSGSKA